MALASTWRTRSRVRSIFSTDGCMYFFVGYDPYTGMIQDMHEVHWDDIDWGDQDVEWVMVDACRFLRGDTGPLGQMADGVHLICGFWSDSWDGWLYQQRGEKFASYCDSYSIKSAWFKAADEEEPSGAVACVFGADHCANDSIMGGPIYVTRDPTSSSTYSCWYHTVP